MGQARQECMCLREVRCEARRGSAPAPRRDSVSASFFLSKCLCSRQRGHMQIGKGEGKAGCVRKKRRRGRGGGVPCADVQRRA